MSTVNATFLYSGLSDYWCGNSDRWNDDSGCLFASYDHETTLRQLVDEWCDDFMGGGDCDSLPEDITDEDIRSAILSMLTPEGRSCYDSGGLWEGAQDVEPISEDERDYCELPVAIILISVDEE